VTESITGIDLVKMQIRVAEGNKLPFSQDDLSMSGHAIECRIYAEDPLNNFMPSPGKLLRHDPPSGFGVRLDSGVKQGDEISLYYDPMISKLTTWGATRMDAIARMKRALTEYEIAGVPTTISFCRFVMEHEAFTSGNFSTHFVQDHFQPEQLEESDEETERIIAIAAALYADSRLVAAKSNVNGAISEFSAWRRNRTAAE
jgi:propionyl-CoA carboxylase alpha chain